MNSPEIKSEQNKDVEYVYPKKLSCAGVEGPLGHPKVYLDMGDDNQIVCPYCSKLFILK